MAITTTDIKLLASSRMNDEDDGGGRMTGVAIQDAIENNVFPDLSAIDRAFGRFQARKLFAAVLVAGTDPLLGANVIVEDEPDDATVRTFLWAGQSQGEQRQAAVANLEVSHWEPLGPGGVGKLEWNSTGTKLKSIDGSVIVAAGQVVYCWTADSEYASPVLITSATSGADNTGFTTSTGGSTQIYSVQYDGTWAGTADSGVYKALQGVPSTASSRLYATAAVQGTLSANALYADVDSLLVSVVPKVIGPGIDPGDESVLQINPVPIVPAGVAVAFRAGDAVVVHHTADTSAATLAASDTVNVARTDLSRMVVIDANGASILSGYTVNLSTGILTVTNVTGWAQPVKVRHTIEEVLGITRTGYPEIRSGSPVGSDQATAGPFELSESLVMYGGRANVGTLRVHSKTGQNISDLTYFSDTPGQPPQRYFDINLATGTATFGTGIPAYQRDPFITSHSPVTLVVGGTTPASATSTSPQANPNRVSFNRALTRAFPAGTLLSSALLLGDLQATVGAAFSQGTWTNVWSDTRIGSAIAAQYQQEAHPIVVADNGAVTERWAVIFTSSTTYRLVGETLGEVITAGSVNGVLAPLNPATGQPYFTLAAAGWGGGWSAGNVLRFNTRGAAAPLWVARVTLPSVPTSTPDSLTIAVRGNVNA